MIIKIDKLYFQRDDGHLFITLQYESNPTEMPLDENTLNKYKYLNTSLANSDLYTYYEINTQPLFLIQDSLRDIPGAQISPNVQEDFDLQVTKGRLFNSQDFILTKDAIPVLVGSDYSGVLELGDCFIAEYLYCDYTFEVVGILSKDLCIEITSGIITLDEKIVMPSFTVPSSPQTDAGMVSSIIHYANKTSGKLYFPQNDFDLIRAQVLNRLDDAGVGVYSWYTNSSLLNYKNIGIDLKSIYVLSIFIIIVTSITLLILLIMYWKALSLTDMRRFIRSLATMATVLILANCASMIALRLVFHGDWVGWNVSYINTINILICGGSLGVGLFVWLITQKVKGCVKGNR